MITKEEVSIGDAIRIEYRIYQSYDSYIVNLVIIRHMPTETHEVVVTPNLISTGLAWKGHAQLSSAIFDLFWNNELSLGLADDDDTRRLIISAGASGYFAPIIMGQSPAIQKEFLFLPRSIQEGEIWTPPAQHAESLSRKEVVGSLKFQNPEVTEKRYHCSGLKSKLPCNDPLGRAIFDQIVHLNDVHCMSREDIADWLETLDEDLSLVVRRPDSKI